MVRVIEAVGITGSRIRGAVRCGSQRRSRWRLGGRNCEGRLLILAHRCGRPARCGGALCCRSKNRSLLARAARNSLRFLFGTKWDKGARRLAAELTEGQGDKGGGAVRGVFSRRGGTI